MIKFARRQLSFSECLVISLNIAIVIIKATLF